MTVTSARWPAAAAATLLWALVAGSLTLWWLHMPHPAGSVAEEASAAQAVDKAKAHDAVVRALGRASAAENAPDVQKRFVLLGVIAGAGGQGSALLMVDGQPARTFIRGQEVVEGWRLAAVDSTGVRLEPLQAGAALALPLPQRP